MRKRIFIFVFLFSGLISHFAFAQKETSAIEGQVKDNENHPIAGVTITACSPSLIGSSSIAITDEDGEYRFPVLAPGTYEVKAKLTSFQTVTRKEIRLALGVTLTVDFSMDVNPVAESIEITGEPPLIDVTTSAVSQTIPREIISNLPRVDKIQNLLALTPGVSDDLVAYGTDNERQNSIWVDGVSVSDPRSGKLIIDFSQNWLDQVQVSGIGAPAQYGGFTGVVGNFITRSGGNQFHGLVETFFQNEKLTSDNIPDPEPERPFTTYDFSLQLGGPILHDKLWFFSGFEYPHTETQTIGFPENRVDAQSRWLNKLTYKVNENNTLEGFAHWNHQRIDNINAGPHVSPEAALNSEKPQASWNATWISLLGSHTTFEGRVGGFYSNDHSIEDRPDLPGHIELSTGFTSINAAGRDISKRVRFQANASMSHYADDFIHGDHDFRFGTEFERSKLDTATFYNGGKVYFDYNGAPSFRYLSMGYDAESSNHRASAYAQDDWSITDRFSVNVGVRWDHNRGLTNRGLVYSNDPFAPRMGFVWQLDQNNQTVIKAHYGDYYQALLERHYFNLHDPIDFITSQSFQNGEWVTTDVFHPFLYHASNYLSHPYVHQFTVGVDHVFPHEIPVGVHYIYRRWENLIQLEPLSEFDPMTFINPVDGKPITVYIRRDKTQANNNLTNPPGLYRRYDGVEFFVNKQFANKLNISASLVYSRLKGNVNDIFTVAPFGTDPNSSINFPGNLTVDRPLSWKVVGTYFLPWRFNAGWFFRHESGNTWNATIRVPGVFPPYIRINGEPAGSRQLPSKNLLDLRFEKLFRIYSGDIHFTVDVFNLFNTAFATEVDNEWESPIFGQPVNFNSPRQMRLGVRYTF